MIIDIRTLSIVLCIITCLQAVAFFLQFSANRSYRGIGWWLLWSISIAAGLILILLREVVTFEQHIIFITNIILLAGQVFQYIGVMRFLDRKENRTIIHSTFIIFLLSTFYVIYVNRDDTARIMILYLLAAFFSFLSARGLYLYKTSSITTSARFLTAVFLLYGIFFVFRSALAPTFAPIESVFTPAMIQIASFAVILISGILWVSGFIVMVNQRSNAEMREAKDHFELIFNTGPNAVLITRLVDGYFVEINEGFTALTGFTPDEVIGKTILDLDIWRNPADRQKVVAELSEKGFCENLEFIFRRKNGNLFNGIISAKTITLRGLPHIISVTHDITDRKEAEDLLRKNEEKFRLLVENSHDILYSLTSEGVFIFVSPVWTTLLGHPVNQVVGKSFQEFVHPDDIPGCMVFLQSVIGLGQRQAGVEYRVKHLDGTWYWHTSSAVPFQDDGGTIMGFYGIARDITERKRAAEALRESEQKYRLLADNANDVIWTMTLDGKFTYVSPSIFQMRGFTPEDVLAQSLEQAVCPSSLDAIRFSLEAVKMENGNGQKRNQQYFEVEQPCKDGTTIWTESTARLMYNDAEQPVEYVVVSRDITERRRLQEELRQQATTDELTGVINRRHFLKLAQNELTRAIRLNHTLSIVMHDIDHFKQINDAYGHATGDLVLAAFAKICQNSIRDIDIFARYGGDEFILLLPEANSDQAYSVVERIRLSLTSTPVYLGNKTISISISSGITSLSDTVDSLDTLLDRADKALYQAKEMGRNRVIVG